eukprot:5363955-Amphidinium_carterae.1
MNRGAVHRTMLVELFRRVILNFEFWKPSRTMSRLAAELQLWNNDGPNVLQWTFSSVNFSVILPAWRTDQWDSYSARFTSCDFENRFPFSFKTQGSEISWLHKRLQLNFSEMFISD